MNILAFESSCDETAAAVVRDGRTVLSDAILSQADMHALYGGVVPEIASRKHVEAIAGLSDQALREAGFHQERALEYVRRETRKAAEAKREEMRRMARLPFAYAIYRLGVRRFMKRNFPEEGWRTEWVRCDGREIHFDLYRCLYWDVTQAHGCPELCCVYCENDDVSFSGLLPKIRFVRAGTLAKGAACCDFHFCRGK